MKCEYCTVYVPRCISQLSSILFSCPWGQKDTAPTIFPKLSWVPNQKVYERCSFKTSRKCIRCRTLLLLLDWRRNFFSLLFLEVVASMNLNKSIFLFHLRLGTARSTQWFLKLPRAMLHLSHTFLTRAGPLGKGREGNQCWCIFSHSITSPSLDFLLSNLSICKLWTNFKAYRGARMTAW